MVYFTFGMFFYGPPSSRSKPMIQQSSPVVAHLGRSDLAVACSDAGDDDGGGGGGGGDEMTVFHFLNCAALTFGPHVVYYSATPLTVESAMAAYTTKIFALFALIALSASATTAITTMQYFPPTLAMGTTDPYRQYMMQTLGMGSSTAMFMSQPMALLQQQCCMQLQGMMPQCNCDTSCQMMQSMQQVICAGLGEQQMMMNMAMQMPYMCSMAPVNFQLSSCESAMAAYTTKIFALFALIALSASATTAITTMQYFPPTLAMGTTDPYRQYMMQTLGMGSSTAMFMSQPMALLQQQCCMQLQGMMPQCNCDTSCQMMQSMQQVICAGLGEQQMMMNMAMQMPYMSEYDTIGTCVKAAVVYLGTALVKLVCLATLLKVPENDSFDPYQELMKIFIGFIDVAGLYFALTQLTHRNISQNHKFQAVGLGWAFADSVLHRLAPLWIGARGLEFTWEYIFQGLEANANLVMTLSLAALGSLMWLRKNKPRTLLLEEIIRVADSKGGWLRAVLLTGHGFHQLAAVLSLSETNVRNEFANCRRFMQIAGDSRS
uniref:BOS complex subunit TMEM147 n=1 Tax=Oryza meridionalis TaxID=40149 RepID=A0A0E0D7C4_9ORYZ